MPVSDVTSRRSVVATGARLAYGVPMIVSSLKLSSVGAGAVSHGGNCDCELWILSSEPGGVGAIRHDDDIVVSVNGSIQFEDAPGPDDQVSGPLGIDAHCGDLLRIEAYNTNAPVQSLSAIWLTCQTDTSNTRKLTDGVYQDNAPDSGIENRNKFFDETYVV